MAKTKISEFDSIPANNTDIDGINIAEGCAPSGINNAIRELMSQLKDQQTGASDDNFTVGGNLTVDGTTTLTGNVTFSGTTNILPAGVITLWSGAIAAVPSGWYLCDGTNGTPNLRDRFVVGAGTTYAVGDTGGSAAVTLDATMIPAHTHSVSASGTTAASGNHTHTFSGTSSGQSATHSHSVSDPGHSHTMGGTFQAYGYPNVSSVFTQIGNGSTGGSATGITLGNASSDHSHTYSGTTSDISATHTHTVTVTGTSGSTGGGLAHENRPPYYALAYIMKA